MSVIQYTDSALHGDLPSRQSLPVQNGQLEAVQSQKETRARSVVFPLVLSFLLIVGLVVLSAFLSRFGWFYP